MVNIVICLTLSTFSSSDPECVVVSLLQ